MTPESFLLFVAGTEANSALAVDNLARLCEAHLPGRHRVDTVDVLTRAGLAHTHRVLVTPTLIRLAPLPKITLYGNLQDTPRVLAALGLTGRR